MARCESQPGESQPTGDLQDCSTAQRRAACLVLPRLAAEALTHRQPMCAAQSFLFLNKKCRRLFTNRQKAGKIAWTVIYRRAHRKVSPGQAQGYRLSAATAASCHACAELSS